MPSEIRAVNIWQLAFHLLDCHTFNSFFFLNKNRLLMPLQWQAFHFPSLLLCQAQNPVSFEVFPSLLLSLVTYKVAVEQYVFVGVRAPPLVFSSLQNIESLKITLNLRQSQSHVHVFLLLLFLELEYNCLKMLCQFLLYNIVNQPYV